MWNDSKLYKYITILYVFLGVNQFVTWIYLVKFCATCGHVWMETILVMCSVDIFPNMWPCF